MTALLQMTSLEKYYALCSYSAGVGRTGVFIALDIILEKSRKEGVVDVMGVVNNMRKQRMRMVQTVVSTYIYLYPLTMTTLVTESDS